MSAAPVIVGIDGSAGSKKALHWAASYGRISGAPVEAVIAWDRPATYGMPVLFDEAELKDRAQQILDREINEELTDRAAITERLVQGHAAAVLTKASEHAQLLVVGAHDHRATGRVLGSVVLHCVQHAHCPVVVVRDA